MEDNSFSAKGFLVWGICALFFLYEFFIRTVLGTFQYSFMQDFGLTFTQFSFMSTTVFFLLYGLMQIPVGFILDRIGLRRSLLTGIGICVVATLGFAHSPSFGIAIMFRIMMGIGASFGFICLLMSVYDWMPKAHQSFLIGLSQFIGVLGPILAGGPLVILIEKAGLTWSALFDVLSAVGLGLAVLVWFGVENKKRKAGHYQILSRPEKTRAVIQRLLSNSQVWFIAIIAACLYFSLEYLSENEGRAFLALKGYSLGSASYMLTLSWIGYAFGAPLIGFISDRLQRRKTILFVSASVSIISLIGIVFAMDKLVLQLSFIGLGIGTSGQLMTYALITEQFTKQFVATGLGLNNAMLGIFASMNAPALGYLLEGMDKPLTLESYQMVFGLLIFINVLALLMIVIRVKETYNKSAVDFTYLTLKNRSSNMMP